MNLPIYTYIAFGSTLFFAILAIRFSHEEGKLKKLLKQKEKDQEEKNLQLSMLEYIQQEIDYSLNTEKIVATFIQSLEKNIPFAILTTLFIHDDKLVFDTIIQDKVSKNFIEGVKKNIIASCKEIYPYPLPNKIEENIQGTLLTYTNATEEIASYFQVPLVINKQIVAVIALASPVEDYYSTADMKLVNETIEHAANAVTKLREVIETEKRRLSSLITSLHDGIIMIDENDILQVINNSAKDILRIRKESPTMFDVMQTLAQSFPIEEKLQQAKKQNKTISEKEVTIDDKTVQVFITPVVATFTSNDGKKEETKVIGTSIVLHDISIEKSLNKMKDDFTNEIVHELRSPLTAIKASAMLIATDKSLSDEEAKFINIIVHQSERMIGDISSLLDAAKLETGKFSVVQKAGDIGKLIQESLTLFKTTAENKKISLVADIADNLPQGLIDNNRLMQVINNLISNSMKFTPENGTIKVKATYHYNEHLPTTNTNPGILIAVSDTGIGIAKEKQGVLFSKFGQIRNEKYTPKEAGTGLGLYVSKGIVEAHGGSMFLDSEEGKGTTISFTIPIVIAAKETAIDDTSANITMHTEASHPPVTIIPGVH